LSQRDAGRGRVPAGRHRTRRTADLATTLRHAGGALARPPDAVDVPGDPAGHGGGVGTAAGRGTGLRGDRDAFLGTPAGPGGVVGGLPAAGRRDGGAGAAAYRLPPAGGGGRVGRRWGGSGVRARGGRRPRRAGLRGVPPGVARPADLGAAVRGGGGGGWA